MNKRKIYIRISLTILLSLGVMILNTHHGLAGDREASKEGEIFSTWEGFEPDKCASIWLIQRFIDKNATVKFLPKGEIISDGIPFDLPDARFRRYANKSTFESFMDHYQITDPRLLYIGKIIHDIEINIWERKVMPETISVQDALTSIILEDENAERIMEEGNRYFDDLYRELELKK
ncbi:MAG: chromate resistance protein ChrB domain-containing protein [bacterium]